MRNQERPAGLLTKIAGAVINFFAASDARSRDRNDLDKPSPVAFDTPILPASRVEAERAAADTKTEPVATSEAEEAIAYERAPLELTPAEAVEAVDTSTETAAPVAPLLLTPDLATANDAAEMKAPAVEEVAPAAGENEGQLEPEAEEEPVEAMAEEPAVAEGAAAEEPAVAEEAAAEEVAAADEPVSEIQDAQSEADSDAVVAEDAAEAQGGEFDLQQLVASLATDKRGRAKTPKDFYGVMRFRFGMNRETVKDTLELCEHGVAKRGEGKKVLCAWVETLLRNVPGEQLKLSEIRATLPDFIYKTYGPHAAQGLVGAVSSCEFIAVIRDGEPVEGRAKAGDTICIA